MSLQLLDARKESTVDISEDSLFQDPWMVLSEIRPNDNDDDEETIENDAK